MLMLEFDPEAVMMSVRYAGVAGEAETEWSSGTAYDSQFAVPHRHRSRRPWHV